MRKPVTICVLTYGDYPALARAAIESILRHCDRSRYLLVVGANAVGDETRRYLEALRAEGAIDRLHLSVENVNKCPMMRRMLAEVDTELVWWFDDDSYVAEPDALERWLEIAGRAPESTVLWGHQFFFGNERDFSYGGDVVGFVRSARWYRGLEPPSWEPGGKGEFDFEGRGAGDGRWFFVTGGCWLARTRALRLLDWPDPRLVKRNDDVFLCEAIRQQGWGVQDVGSLGVAINTEARRGGGEDPGTMRLQLADPGPEPAAGGLDLSGWFFPEEEEVYRRLAGRVRNGLVVEVGVWKGRSLSAILDLCRSNGNRVAAVDTWRPPREDPDYAEAWERDVYEIFLNNLRLLGHLGTVTILREDSAKAAARFADGSVDLLFLDADHAYEAVRRDLLAWLPKIRPGGILCGHDYTWKEGVRRALHELFGDGVTLLGGSVWQVAEGARARPSGGRGCVFIPTFRDTGLLAENFGGRPELTARMDVCVFDDNFEATESARVEALCQANGWRYFGSERPRHGEWRQEQDDLSRYNRFIWESMTSLADEYEFVVKMDTDAYVVDSSWDEEMARLLRGRTAIAGTPEHRPSRDVMSFWNLARAAGYPVAAVPDYVMHMQGGIYGLSRGALRALREMGFLAGEHVFFAEDCYMSYSCQLLGVEFLTTRTVGSWFRPYRPPLEVIRSLKAIHPLARSEWHAFANPSDAGVMACAG